MPPPYRAPAILLTLAAAALLYLIGNATIPLWDRDEPRYAQTSRQMERSGDWVVPRFLDEPRTEKPPLIYWCQATAMKVLGDGSRRGVFAARLPSALAMLATLVLLRFAIGNAIGAWTALILASSAVVILAAKMCLTDSLLLFFITAGQLCLYAMYRGRREAWIWILFWVALGLGSLTKGPIALVPAGMTMAALAVMRLLPPPVLRGRVGEGVEQSLADPTQPPPPPSPGVPGEGERILSPGAPVEEGRFWWGWATRPWFGIFILAAIVGPWLYLVESRSPGFLRQIFHAAERHAASTTEKHVEPPGYYLLTIWVFFSPWCLLLPTAIGLAWKNRQAPAVRFALAAVIGPWIFQEIMPNKGPFYILPIFPPLAFLVADALRQCLGGTADDLRRKPFSAMLAVWCLIAIALAVAPWLLLWPMKMTPQPIGVLIALTAVGLAYAVVVPWGFIKHPRRAVLAMAFGGMLLTGILLAGYLPRADFLQLSFKTGQALQRLGATDHVQMMQYKEPSLAFYQGGTIREQNHEHLSPPDALWVVLPRALWDQQPQRERAKWEVMPTGPLFGLDLAGKVGKSRWAELMVLRRRS